MIEPAARTTPPADQALRERFISELDRNFSVIAPAGVGKTKSIVDRIVHLATGDADRARRLLPKLVVVTYTNKAAGEMHQRARNEIVSRGVGLEVLSHFNRAFFGTIHGFCLSLLRTHGHFLGLAAQLELAENDDALWISFLRQTDVVAPSVPETVRSACFRHLRVTDVMQLGRRVRPAASAGNLNEPPPSVDLSPLLDFVPSKKNQNNVVRGQSILRTWQQALSIYRGYVPLPEYKLGGADFQALWEETFAPLRRWLHERSLVIAQDVARAYREYRLARGQITFDDQVELAGELIQHPEAGPLLRGEGYRIILDEAQDTDPAQFNLLLELARPVTATGTWLVGGGAPPEPGRFCMVGDPQQSIYGSRADLAYYNEIRDKLATSGAAEELTFEVTFRCSQAIVNTVNQLAPVMLDGRDGQADFVPLKTRPGASSGQVIRWIPKETPEVMGSKKPIAMMARSEARQLAAWLRSTGLAALRAPSWSDVAILCPRKRWFGPLERALRAEGLDVQIQSHRDKRCDTPSYAWLTALMVCVTEPRNGYELVGVLREIFGLPDSELAAFSHGNGSVFQIEEPTDGPGQIAETLNLLACARAAMLNLPLRDAVAELIETTSLAQRLALLPGCETSREELDALLVLAAEAEARGDSLPQWARQLRDGLEDLRDETPPATDAIQLITCQKAKGLQWHAVVLPFLYRQIAHRREYPLVLNAGPGRPPLVAYSAEDAIDIRSALDRKNRQEGQRLLYVALTRARETLVIVDDAAFNQRASQSFADLLGLIEAKEPSPAMAALKKLPADVSPPGGPPIPPSQETAARKTVVPLTEALIEKARARSRDTIQRILPHALARHPPPDEPDDRMDSDPEWNAPAGSSARAYGIWWHAMIEQIDWSLGRAEWQKIHAHYIARCPQPDRGRHEWELLMKSALLPLLTAAGSLYHAEMPILWKRSASAASCVEGLIDLAVLNPDGSRWQIIDWKTNLVEADNAHTLLDIYAPQMDAYAESLQTITNLPVEAGIYSTATGRYLTCRF